MNDTFLSYHQALGLHFATSTYDSKIYTLDHVLHFLYSMTWGNFKSRNMKKKITNANSVHITEQWQSACMQYVGTRWYIILLPASGLMRRRGALDHISSNEKLYASHVLHMMIQTCELTDDLILISGEDVTPISTR